MKVDGREQEERRSRLRAEADCREEGKDDGRALGVRESCTRALMEDGRA